jgi:hypothetical protein
LCDVERSLEGEGILPVARVELLSDLLGEFFSPRTVVEIRDGNYGLMIYFLLFFRNAAS